MLRYRIGRIEGAWKNFVPPIQGGVFRTPSQMEESVGEDDSANEQASVSSNSREPSPVFDNGEDERQDIRRRTAGKRSASSSVSSRPSADGGTDGMTYLDSITHEKISLDLDRYPPTDEATQACITAQYRQLHQRIKDEGLYQCNYWAYAAESCSYLASAVLMFVFLHYEHYALAGLSLGFLWHQLVFTAHDAAHMGITHGYYVDSIISIIIADFIGGLSIGWWKRNHNVHHIVTNAPEHDPDIEHMPLFAISHRFLGSLRSTYYNRMMDYDFFARGMLRIQAWTYYPLLAFGRFNLYVLSWDYLIFARGPRKGAAAWLRYLELAGHVFFWAWFGYGVVYKMIPDGWSRFSFIMVSHISSSPLHLQIVLSHFAMSTSDLGPQESFAQKMLRTTMDVDCPPWLDFIHGGLQFQAIHHLYPRIPRHNLRETQKLVMNFCKEVGIPYALFGFVNSNQQVIGRLSEVSRQAAILAKCQRTIMENGDFHLH